MTDDSVREPESSGEAVVQAPQMQLIYSNAAGLRGGVFDVSLEFGYVIPPSGDENPLPPQWLVRVAMSWEHARAFHTLLGDQLEKYEATVGEIPSIENLKVSEANADDR